MSSKPPYFDDRRGLLFTINRDSNPVYQVESASWAHAENRWSANELPPEILAKVAYLKESGKPGAFVQFLQGEDGVYVICEKNIKNLPDAAADELVNVPRAQAVSARALAPYDIIICAKGGPIHGQNGETFETQEDDYYVLRCQSWGRFVLSEPKQPDFVGTTKEFLLLLDNLHGKNFLSMSPDPTHETLPPDFGEPTDASFGIACYVLNLARFKR
jgi:hypothetical protein